MKAHSLHLNHKWRTRKGHTYTPIYIDRAEVERVTSVHISEDLPWTLNTSSLIKKVQQGVRGVSSKEAREAVSPQKIINITKI